MGPGDGAWRWGLEMRLLVVAECVHTNLDLHFQHEIFTNFVCPSSSDVSFLSSDTKAQGGDREGLAEDGQDRCHDGGWN